MSDKTAFWPNNARLAVSISLMSECGGQPMSGAPGVIPEPIKNCLPDMPTNGVFQYGVYEGTPRQATIESLTEVLLAEFVSSELERTSAGCQLHFMRAIVRTLVERLELANTRVAAQAART